MKTLLPGTWPQFFTATVAEWRPLFEANKHKDIIVDSLQFLVKNNRIILYGFVIMINHIHLIWQATDPAFEKITPGHPLKKVQQSFMKYTGQQIKFDLVKNNPGMLELYRSNAFDREYNFWKRRSLGIALFSPFVFQQKLNYIHYNPVKAGLCAVPQAYYYSSANFYFTGIDEFNMLTHYEGN